MQPLDYLVNVITVCTFITATFSVLSLFSTIAQRIKEPNKTQDEKIEMLDRRITSIEEHIQDDTKQFERLVQANQVTHNALLALMSHIVNGNDVDKVKNALDEMNHYLVGK